MRITLLRFSQALLVSSLAATLSAGAQAPQDRSARPGGSSGPGGSGGPPSNGGQGGRPSPGGQNGGNRPQPGNGAGNQPRPGQGGGNRPSPGRPGGPQVQPPRPSPGGGRPNPGPVRPNPGPGRPVVGRPGGGRPPQWGRPPQQRPSYQFRPNDRSLLHRYYLSRLRYINRSRRPVFAVGGYFPYGDIGYLTPVPASLYGQIPPPPPGYQVGYFDGYVVVYDPLTYFIADLVDLLQ